MKKIYSTPSIQVTNLMMNTSILAGSVTGDSMSISTEETVDTPDMLSKESWADED